MPKISIVGTGYVGLVTGACFAEIGHQVICVDNDLKKVEVLRAGDIPIYEPGLEELVKKNVASGRLNFTTSTAEGVQSSDVVFIAVPTPPQPDGSVDLSFIERVARDIAAANATRCCVKVRRAAGIWMVVERLNGAGIRRPAAEVAMVSASSTVISPTVSDLYQTALFWLLKAPNSAATTRDCAPGPRRLEIEIRSRSATGGRTARPPSAISISFPPALPEGQMGSSMEMCQPVFSSKSHTAVLSDRYPAVFTWSSGCCANSRTGIRMAVATAHRLLFTVFTAYSRPFPPLL